MFIKSLLYSGPSVKDFTWQNSLKQVLLAFHTTDHKTEFAGEPVELTMQFAKVQSKRLNLTS